MNYIVLLIICLDQILKNIVNFTNTDKLLFNVFHIKKTINSGISFNFFKDVNYLLYIIGIINCYLIYKLYYSENKIDKLASIFSLAGGLSNIIDRIFYEGVIDFIRIDIAILNMIVFNIADLSIALALGLLIISLFRKKEII